MKTHPSHPSPRHACPILDSFRPHYCALPPPPRLPHQAVARAKAVVRKAAIKVAQVKVVSMKRAAAKVARTLQADRRRDGSTRSLTVHAKKHYAVKGAKKADLWMQRQMAKRAKVRNARDARPTT